MYGPKSADNRGRQQVGRENLALEASLERKQKVSMGAAAIIIISLLINYLILDVALLTQLHI